MFRRICNSYVKIDDTNFQLKIIMAIIWRATD